LGLMNQNRPKGTRECVPFGLMTWQVSHSSSPKTPQRNGLHECGILLGATCAMLAVGLWRIQVLPCMLAATDEIGSSGEGDESSDCQLNNYGLLVRANLIQ
jgi:hypothetical protein